MSRNHSSKLKLIALAGFTSIIFLLLSLIGIYFAFTYYTSPTDPTNSTSQIFIIKKGESISSIGTRLEQEGFIKNATAFKIAVKFDGLAGKIQAGDFRINKSMDLKEIASSLTKGSEQSIWVTLLEGWRREEIAQELASQFSNYGLEFNQQEFLTLTREKEGYLFPDTYLIPKTATPQTVVSIISNNFDKKVDSVLKNQIKATGRTLEDVVIMASIVEREARGSARPIVAGILWKRLDNDWPLQADATLQYAKGVNKSTGEWWDEPLGVDKEVVSPYNTYKNQGLPPGPITNPSLSSIQASANPTSSDYWYYISDLTGQMHYAVTYDEHLANVNKYLR